MAQLTQADGTKIRRVRERKGLPLGEFVRLLAEQGLPRHPDYIRNIELGHKQPSEELLKGIAAVLEVEIDAIIGPEKHTCRCGARHKGTATSPRAAKR